MGFPKVGSGFGNGDRNHTFLGMTPQPPGMPPTEFRALFCQSEVHLRLPVKEKRGTFDLHQRSPPISMFLPSQTSLESESYPNFPVLVQPCQGMHCIMSQRHSWRHSQDMETLGSIVVAPVLGSWIGLSPSA